MAVIDYQSDDDFIRNRSSYITWANMADGDTGQPLPLAGHADKTLHVFGDWGVGGQLTFKGSNDPRAISDYENATDTASWVTLKDPYGMPYTLSADGGDLLVTNFRVIRPEVTGGDGDTDLQIVLACKIAAR